METDSILDIFKLFSLRYTEISLTEDCDELIGHFKCTIEQIPNQDNYDKIIHYISPRDYIHISILQESEVVKNFKSTNGCKFNSFIEELTDQDIGIGNNIEIKFTIIKNQEDSLISIYCINEFISYLENLDFLSFLSVINNRLNKGHLIFEIQEIANNCIFTTNTITCIYKENETELCGIGEIDRVKRLNIAQTICHWDETKLLLLPEDLYPHITTNKNDRLYLLFQKVCLLYSCMFLFDYFSLTKEKISYKLTGFKTFGQEIKTKAVKEINLNNHSSEDFYNIYQWCYLGGNTNDKINIARNIISLNFVPETLELNKTTIDAIQSNFKIYERENVKQYIQVRNKLSELLINLQTKIGDIVDGFIGDYKKNITTLVSFFISVIAIRVVSKGDFVGGFTNEILILSLAFLLISIGLLFYSRWEFSEKVNLFEKHYEQLKDRYKDLLSEKELNAIFEECNPQNSRSNVSFVREQKKKYTILWIVSIALLFIAIVIIFFINNKKFYDNLINDFNYTKNVIQRIFNN